MERKMNMKKSIIKMAWVVCVATLYLGQSMTAYASEISKSSIENIGGIAQYSEENYEEMVATVEERLFTTDYIVITTKEPMRTGAGLSYSIVGYLYEGDVVAVRSISGGWAKLKVNGEWRYVLAASLQKK